MAGLSENPSLEPPRGCVPIQVLQQPDHDRPGHPGIVQRVVTVPARKTVLLGQLIESSTLRR